MALEGLDPSRVDVFISKCTDRVKIGEVLQSTLTSFHSLRLAKVVEDLSSGVADQVPRVRKT